MEQRASEPFGCVLDMLLESTCVARFAAETSFQSDRAATAASRVRHALARLMEKGQPTLQHGLERWLVRRVGWHYPVPNRGTRETPDTHFLSNPNPDSSSRNASPKRKRGTFREFPSLALRASLCSAGRMSGFMNNRGYRRSAPLHQSEWDYTLGERDQPSRRRGGRGQLLFADFTLLDFWQQAATIAFGLQFKCETCMGQFRSCHWRVTSRIRSSAWPRQRLYSRGYF